MKVIRRIESESGRVTKGIGDDGDGGQERPSLGVVKTWNIDSCRTHRIPSESAESIVKEDKTLHEPTREDMANQYLSSTVLWGWRSVTGRSGTKNSI